MFFSSERKYDKDSGRLEYLVSTTGDLILCAMVTVYFQNKSRNALCCVHYIIRDGLATMGVAKIYNDPNPIISYCVNCNFLFKSIALFDLVDVVLVRRRIHVIRVLSFIEVLCT